MLHLLFSHASRVIDTARLAQDGPTSMQAHRTVVQTLDTSIALEARCLREKRHLRLFVVPYASLPLRSFKRAFATQDRQSFGLCEEFT